MRIVVRELSSLSAQSAKNYQRCSYVFLSEEFKLGRAGIALGSKSSKSVQIGEPSCSLLKAWDLYAAKLLSPLFLGSKPSWFPEKPPRRFHS